MNRSNVPYIVAAALLVLAIGGWGIFLAGGNHADPPEEPDAGGVDVGVDQHDSGSDAGAAAVAPSVDAENPDVQLAPPPKMADAGELASTADASTAIPTAPAAAEKPIDEAMTKPTAVDGVRANPPSKGSISPDAIRNVVAAMKPTIKACYDNLLDEFDDASGKVTVTFRVEAEGDEGRVTVIEVDEESTLMDDKLHDCLTNAFGDAVFPVPEGGDTVQVRYPFNFATK